MQLARGHKTPAKICVEVANLKQNKVHFATSVSPQQNEKHPNKNQRLPENTHSRGLYIYRQVC